VSSPFPQIATVYCAAQDLYYQSTKSVIGLQFHPSQPSK